MSGMEVNEYLSLLFGCIGLAALKNTSYVTVAAGEV